MKTNFAFFLLSQLQARAFQYHHVLRPDCSQLDVYAMAARPLVKGRRVAAASL